MNISVCSVIYNEAKRYIPEFISGIQTASLKYKNHGRVNVIIFNDDMLEEEAEKLTKPLTDTNNVTIVHNRHKSSIADIRKQLLLFAADNAEEIIVFTDCDDVLCENAFILHKQVLDKYDFSYGDQILIDEYGNNLGTTLYADWYVPEKVSSSRELLNGNFIGFSGAAIKRYCLKERTNCNIPKDIIAVDWWFFTNLLNHGNQGSVTNKPVVFYRQHSNNVHGINHKPDRELIMKYIEITCAHFRNLPGSNDARLRLTCIEKLSQFFCSNPEYIINQLNLLKENKVSMYSDIIFLSMKIFRHNSNL